MTSSPFRLPALPVRLLWFALLLGLVLLLPLALAHEASLLMLTGASLLVGAALGLVLVCRWHASRLAAMLDAQDLLGMPMLLVDDEDAVALANNAFLKLCGQSALQTLEGLPADWQTVLLRHIEAARQRGVSTPEQVVLSAPGRESLTLNIAARRIQPHAGRAGVLLRCEDLGAIHAELAAALSREHAQRTRHERFVQTLIDVIPQPVYVKDEANRFVLVNDSFCTRHKIARQQLIGQALPVLHADVLRAEEAQLEDLRVMAGTPIFREEHLQDADGELYVIISKQSCEDAQGRRVLVGTQIDITPWRKAEEGLRAALARETGRSQRIREFTQRLLDVIPEPVYVKDAQARYIMINEAFCQQRLQSADEILGRSARELAPDEATAQRVLAEDQAVLAGSNVRKEDRTRHPLTGQDRWRIVTKGACLNAEGEPVIIGANFDITAIRQAEMQQAEMLQHERELRERTQCFVQRFIDLLPYPVYVKDEHSRFRMVNEAFVRERGLAREEILGHTPPEVLRKVLGVQAAEHSPEVLSARLALEEDLRVLAGEAINKEVHDEQGPGGRESYRLVSKAACDNAEGERVIVCAQVDITPWRRAENELREVLERERDLLGRTREFLQRFIDVLPHPVYLKHPDGRYQMINQAFAAEVGRSPEAVLGHKAAELAVSDQQARESLQEDEAVLRGERIDIEKHDISAAGKVRDRLICKRLCQDAEGRTVVVGVHVDLSSLRHAERALHAAQAREAEQALRTQAYLQRLLDALPLALLVFDSQGRCQLINQPFSRSQLDGRSLAELPALSLASLPAEWQPETASLARAFAGEQILHLASLLDPASGIEREILSSLSSCLDAGGKPVGVICALNLTELRSRSEAGA